MVAPTTADGDTNWGADWRAFAADVDTRLGNLEGATKAGWSAGALLTEFSGADSTAKLRTAMSTLASESPTKRFLIIPQGTTFSASGPTGATPIPWGTGITLTSYPGPTTEFSYQGRVQVTGTWSNGFLQHNTGTFTRAANMFGIAWEGPGSGAADFLFPDTTNQYQYSTWRDCSFDNWKRVFRRRVLGFAWEGVGYCNNSTDTPIAISGSDWALFNGGRYYIDSPNLDATKFLIDVISSNKGIVGPAFITGNVGTGLIVRGGQRFTWIASESEALVSGGGTFNPGATATAGAQLRVNGGNVVAIHPWFFRGMANPSATGRDDNGIVHVAGGLCRLIAPTFGEYNADETHTENHVYAAGGRCELVAPKVWNLQANGGTGGISARALTTAKGTGGSIATTSLTEL